MNKTKKYSAIFCFYEDHKNLDKAGLLILRYLKEENIKTLNFEIQIFNNLITKYILPYNTCCYVVLFTSDYTTITVILLFHSSTNDSEHRCNVNILR